VSKFTDFIDGLADAGKTLAKAELKALIATAKKNESAFVRLQAENLERWTVMLADKQLTTEGYRLLVRKMEVLTQLETIRLSVEAKASAQRLADGIERLVVGALFDLI